MFNCPNCLPDRKIIKKMEVNGYWISDCSQCNHRFAEISSDASHAETVYSDDYFHGGKDGYPNYLASQAQVEARGRYYARLMKKYTQPGKVLDVGAAAGFVLKGLVDGGWEGTGVEPNPAMAAYALDTLGLNVKCGTVEGFESPEPFDLITMIQVLPHFYDLWKGLEVLAGHTRPGGHWLIETWNKDSLAARAFGKRWHEYSPPSVLHWFSPKTISYFADQFGFHKVASGITFKKITGAHAKSLLGHKLESIPGGKAAGKLLNIVPDRLSVPYLSDDLFWILLKKE